MKYIKTFDENLNAIFTEYLRKPTLIRGIVHLLLVMYSARLAPNLPKSVLLLFENAYFKLFIFSLILWTAQFSPSTSILIALAFMISTNYANQQPLWEFLENVSSETDASVAQSSEVAAPATPEPMFEPEPEPEPEPSPAPAPAPGPVAPKQQQPEPAGCYPVRRHDMSKVLAYDQENTMSSLEK